MANILEQIESKYPVEQITVNGEQVWPYLRIRYYSAHRLKAVGSQGEAGPGLAKPPSKAPSGSRPVRILRSMNNPLGGLRYGFRNWFRRYDYVVLTNSYYRRQQGAKYVNPFLDPVIDELGPNRVLCIERPSSSRSYATSEIHTRHVVSEQVLISLSLHLASLRRRFSRRYVVANRRVLDSIEADLGLRMNPGALLEDHGARRKVFAWLFRIMRPRALLLTCYYGREHAVKAAKDLGIRVVEVQHGVIGKEHPAYNVHREIDRSCFPDHLLVFGKRELATFDNSRFIDPASVHPVGSYYIDYIRDNYRAERQLRDQLSGYKSVVGVTLQWTFEKRLISFIAEAAQLDSDIFYMLIPRQPEQDEYSNMVLPQNVAVIRDKNFYELMAYCDFHSTVYSTCAMEAPALGAQNILVDIDGLARAYFGSVLDDDRVTRFAATAEEYVEIVRSFTRLDRDAVCKLHEDFFAPNYQENIRGFVRTYLPWRLPPAPPRSPIATPE